MGQQVRTLPATIRNTALSCRVSIGWRAFRFQASREFGADRPKLSSVRERSTHSAAGAESGATANVCVQTEVSTAETQLPRLDPNPVTLRYTAAG